MLKSSTCDDSQKPIEQPSIYFSKIWLSQQLKKTTPNKTRKIVAGRWEKLYFFYFFLKWFVAMATGTFG